LFVHQLLTVRPGAPLDYLAAVVDQQVPPHRDHGHEPTGIYEVLGNQHEVVVVWATSIAGQIGLRSSRDAALGLSDDGEADDRLVAWERTAAGYVTGGDTHLMTPLPGTVYGPDDWDEASLDDWAAPHL
jgi:hypothetical protein